MQHRLVLRRRERLAGNAIATRMRTMTGKSVGQKVGKRAHKISCLLLGRLT